MLLRLALMLAGLLLSWSALAGNATSAPHPSFCQKQTVLMRKLAKAGEFDVSPAIDTLMLDVIDGKLSQTREQLSVLSKDDAARWRQSALTIATYAHQPAVVIGLLDDGAEVDGRGTLPEIKRSIRDQIFAEAKNEHQSNSTNPDSKIALGLLEIQLFSGLMDAPILTIATNCDDVEMLDIAFSHHAKLDAQWPKNFNLLTMPVEVGDVAMVKRLLDHGVNPTNGLLAAVSPAHPAMVEYLLGRGAEPCLLDAAIRNEGMTIAAFARRKGLTDDLVNRLTCPAFDKANTASR